MTYTLKEYKVSDFKDQNGNVYVNAAFQEFGEPVTLVVKDPSKLSVGQTLDGDIKPKQKSNGQGTYNRFYRTYNQEGGGYNQSNQGNTQTAQRPAFVPRDDSAIQAQWSIGQAVTVALDMGNNNTDFIEGLAKEFFAMIDRVKTAPKEITAGDIHQEAKSLLGLEGNDKPVDVSDIPF